MKRIGILGGTFDPPHIGHFVIAEEVLLACKLDEIWFIPVNLPPHKDRTNLTSAKDRKKMVEDSIWDTDLYSVCEIEINRKGRSYTVETMEQLCRDYPTYEFYFIIGADMVGKLHTWLRIDDIFKLVQFIGLKRPGYPFSSLTKETILEVDVPQLDISSSMVRERVGNDQSIRFLVPTKVEKYIREQGLYGAKTSTSYR
jgi:nicotinate-nucleotide adenylyltransferase